MSILERMLRDLPFSVTELAKLIRTAPYRYKVYSIPKRSSHGYRIIAQPSPEVKLIQKWVATHVLSKYPVHPAAFAYRPNIGIRDNAAKHVQQRFLLKMDFKDFFPSITSAHFEQHTHKYGQEFEEDLGLLTKILFRNPKSGSGPILSIGAPSSPALSNSIVYDFDVVMGNHAMAHKTIYTRYADDLIFSTNESDALRGLFACVIQTCEQISYPKLTINFDKTVFASKKWNRTVTGLVLSNDRHVSIGWRKKRLLRVQLRRYQDQKLSDEEISRLRGFLSFVRDVEPLLFEKLKAKVHEYARRDLFGG